MADRLSIESLPNSKAIWERKLTQHQDECFRRCRESPELATFADISLVISVVMRCLEGYTGTEVRQILGSVNSIIAQRNQLSSTAKNQAISGVFLGFSGLEYVLCKGIEGQVPKDFFIERTYFDELQWSVGDLFQILPGAEKAQIIVQKEKADVQVTSSRRATFAESQADWLWACDEYDENGLTQDPGEYVAVFNKTVIAASDDDVQLRSDAARSAKVDIGRIVIIHRGF